MAAVLESPTNSKTTYDVFESWGGGGVKVIVELTITATEQGIKNA